MFNGKSFSEKFLLTRKYYDFVHAINCTCKLTCMCACTCACNRMRLMEQHGGLFSDFQHGFRPFQSTADLLTIVSDRIARAFNKSGATGAIAWDISKVFDRYLHDGLLHKHKSYGISGQILGSIPSFLSNRWLWVPLDGESSQEYLVDAGVSQGSILGPTLFLLYINELPDDVCTIAIYADDTTLYS